MHNGISKGSILSSSSLALLDQKGTTKAILFQFEH